MEQVELANTNKEATVVVPVVVVLLDGMDMSDRTEVSSVVEWD